MKNRLMSVAFVALLVALVYNLATAQQRPIAAGTSGRFQLVQGYYQFIGLGTSPSDEKSMFKIDSQTGEAWVYGTGLNREKATVVRRWMKIED